MVQVDTSQLLSDLQSLHGVIEDGVQDLHVWAVTLGHLTASVRLRVNEEVTPLANISHSMRCTLRHGMPRPCELLRGSHFL